MCVFKEWERSQELKHSSSVWYHGIGAFNSKSNVWSKIWIPYQKYIIGIQIVIKLGTFTHYTHCTHTTQWHTHSTHTAHTTHPRTWLWCDENGQMTSLAWSYGSIYTLVSVQNIPLSLITERTVQPYITRYGSFTVTSFFPTIMLDDRNIFNRISQLS